MAKKKRKGQLDIFASFRQYRFLKNGCLSLLLPFSRTDLACTNAAYRFRNRPKKKNSSKRKAGANDGSDFVAYKFFGMPDETQAEELSQNIGSCRWMWNRFKADSDTLYNEMGVRANNTPADYKDVEGLEWLAKTDSIALANVQLNFERAMNEFFSGEKRFPRFKKKGRCKDSYKTNNVSGNIRIVRDCLKLPKITGMIRLRMHREIRPGGILKSCTVEHAPNGKWYFTVVFEYPAEEETVTPGIMDFMLTGDLSSVRHIGLDMSLPLFYVDSFGNTPSYELNGIDVTFIKNYRQLEARIAKEQRKLSKKVYGSNNYYRQCEKVARLHAKAKQRRDDFAHQIAVRLARSYDVISIEDLDMAAMKKSLKLGKSVSDNGWGNFIRILEEKCAKYGSLLIRMDKWFPSSKKCSVCGHVHKELKLSDREYVCPACGHAMDRDHQAAVNIDKEGLRILKGNRVLFDKLIKEMKNKKDRKQGSNTNRRNTGDRLFLLRGSCETAA